MREEKSSYSDEQHDSDVILCTKISLLLLATIHDPTERNFHEIDSMLSENRMCYKDFEALRSKVNQSQYGNDAPSFLMKSLNEHFDPSFYTETNVFIDKITKLGGCFHYNELTQDTLHRVIISNSISLLRLFVKNYRENEIAPETINWNQELCYAITHHHAELAHYLLTCGANHTMALRSIPKSAQRRIINHACVTVNLPLLLIVTPTPSSLLKLFRGNIQELLTELKYAILCNKTEISAFILTSGIELSSFSIGSMLLRDAARYKQSNIIRALHKAGAVYCHDDYHDEPALFSSIRNSDIKTCNLLASLYPSCTETRKATSLTLISPIQFAIYLRDLTMVKWLADHGAKLSVASHENRSCRTALHFAIDANDTRVCQYLIEKNPELAVMTNAFDTPLVHAAYCDHIECLKLIFMHLQNIQTEIYVSPMQYSHALIKAIYINSVEICKFLLENIDKTILDAPVNAYTFPLKKAVDFHRRTISTYKNLQIVRMLAKANFSYRDLTKSPPPKNAPELEIYHQQQRHKRWNYAGRLYRIRAMRTANNMSY